MRIDFRRLSRIGGACAICLVAAASPACKRRAPSPAPPTAPSVLASASSAEGASRCQRRADWRLMLDAEPMNAKPEAARSEDQEEDDEALLPFGVDIGAALPAPFGFAVAGLRGESQAFVALLAERTSRRVDLGQLHGEPETPAIALAGERLLFALRSTDAAGFTVKLGSVAGPESSAPEWGHELANLGKVVAGLALASHGNRGILVYQGAVKGDARVMLGTFSLDNLKAPFEVEPLDAKDAETPRVVRRPGGYWLSWVRTLSEPKKAPSAATAGGPPLDPEERELLDAGLRVLEVAKLDENGSVVGAALRVGEPRRQVLLYDLAPLAGGLLVALRSDSAAPGAEGGAILLSEVGLDGSVHDTRLDDDEIGAGAPALLWDESASRPTPWLAVSAPNDATRIGLVEGARTALHADPLLGRAEVIAVSGGHLLLQRARGRSVTLETLDCGWPGEHAAEKQ